MSTPHATPSEAASARATASTAQGDWTVVEARKLALVCRKHRLRCRVVRSKHHDAQLHIYREGDGFEQRLQAARMDAREQAIDAAWAVVSTLAAATQRPG